MMKNWIIKQEADRVSEVCVCHKNRRKGIGEVKGPAENVSEAQNVSPLTCKQQNFGEVCLPVNLYYLLY